MSFAPVQHAEEFLAQHPDIELFELFILDANGVPRGKLLHRDELLAVYPSGRPLPSTILGLSINGDDVENTGLVWDVGDIDCRAYPLPGSLVPMPWRQIPTAAVQVSMHPSEGMPATVADPRQLLVKVMDGLKAEGYHPVMACELEFYLLDQQRDAEGRPQPARDRDGGRPRSTQVYGLRELEQIEPFLADLYAACKLQGIPARTAISEYAPGQVEITLEHGDALEAMDQAVRYKRLVKGVAHKHGMQACFMAKPFDHLAGTGMHMHVSLADAAGDNLFASEEPAGTPLLRQAIGGMLASLLDSLLLGPGLFRALLFEARLLSLTLLLQPALFGLLLALAFLRPFACYGCLVGLGCRNPLSDAGRFDRRFNRWRRRLDCRLYYRFDHGLDDRLGGR